MENTKKAYIEVDLQFYEKLLIDKSMLEFLRFMYMKSKTTFQMDEPLRYVFGERPPEEVSNDAE
jgi:hypothetical protein